MGGWDSRSRCLFYRVIGWGKKETLKNTNCKWHLEKEKEYEELPVASISADTWR